MSSNKYPGSSIHFVPLALLVLLFQHSLDGTPASKNPLIQVAVTSLKFSLDQNAAPLHQRAFIIKNPSSASLEWKASSNQGWLKFLPGSGSVLPNKTVFIDLVVDPAGFSPGIYTAAAEITIPHQATETFEITMTEQSEFPGVPIGNAQRTFPPDSGMVNVKTEFGAKGDGTNDDTEPIQQAISSVVHHPQTGARIIFFPAGTYLVTRPLVEKDRTSRWSSLLTLQGENRATTIIKLKDKDSLYQSTEAPTDVFRFASQNGTPSGGGNSAFDNNVFDLTIDVGQGNPGAVALDFMGNNYCALRNVILQSSDPAHAGAVGLALQRYAVGPCFMKNVLVNGFDYGIRTANREYSVTFEDLTMLNQRLDGILNADNVLSIRHLVSNNNVPAIANQTGAGLITLVDATLRGGSVRFSAIENNGTLYARDVHSTGYSSVLQGRGSLPQDNSITEYDSGPAIGTNGKRSSLNLPVAETPYFEDTNLANWKSVLASGADPTGRRDSSAAIQAAIDSGATTVYFPTGVYVVARTIRLRGEVRVLEGFDSSINPTGASFQDPGGLEPLFSVEAGTSEVVLDHMRIAAFYPHPSPGIIAIQQNSARPLVLRDSLIGMTPTTVAYRNTSRGSGTLFVENVAGQPWEIAFPQDVYARQINPEGGRTKITNSGGALWILGLKTEGIGTNIATEKGGATEVLGGLIYPVWKVPEERAGFTVTDSRASFVYATSNYKAADKSATFTVQIEEDQDGVKRSVLNSSLPARGLGRVVPLYRSANNGPDEKVKKDHTSAASH